ncbi:hypothetical protein VP01_648g1 [Puccinia sorghi]|uniref:Uncharacterized protein n=1 Tax=Puccinia sorghi TaxID=27349 RepID=A0A0L6UHT5_9BASI|nr:hypothetical protein VP01_648g1 [Puccinia sorghi]
MSSSPVTRLISVKFTDYQINPIAPLEGTLNLLVEAKPFSSPLMSAHHQRTQFMQEIYTRYIDPSIGLMEITLPPSPLAPPLAPAATIPSPALPFDTVQKLPLKLVENLGSKVGHVFVLNFLRLAISTLLWSRGSSDPLLEILLQTNTAHKQLTNSDCGDKIHIHYQVTLHFKSVTYVEFCQLSHSHSYVGFVLLIDLHNNLGEIYGPIEQCTLTPQKKMWHHHGGGFIESYSYLRFYPSSKYETPTPYTCSIFSISSKYHCKKKLDKLHAVAMQHAPANLAFKLHMFAYVEFLAQSLMVGVTTEASWDFLNVNCRPLSKFLLQCIIHGLQVLFLFYFSKLENNSGSKEMFYLSKIIILFEDFFDQITKNYLKDLMSFFFYFSSIHSNNLKWMGIVGIGKNFQLIELSWSLMSLMFYFKSDCHEFFVVYYLLNISIFQLKLTKNIFMNKAKMKRFTSMIPNDYKLMINNATPHQKNFKFFQKFHFYFYLGQGGNLFFLKESFIKNVKGKIKRVSPTGGLSSASTPFLVPAKQNLTILLVMTPRHSSKWDFFFFPNPLQDECKTIQMSKEMWMENLLSRGFEIIKKGF